MVKFSKKSAKIQQNLQHFVKISTKNSAIFKENIEIRERCKGVHCVDLGESFPTHIFLPNLASIQPRTSPVKFARSSVAARRTSRDFCCTWASRCISFLFLRDSASCFCSQCSCRLSLRRATWVAKKDAG